MPEDNHKRSLWLGVGEKVISFVVGVIVAAFLLGGARQRVNTLGKDMAEWKEEWKAEKQHITKMDLEGSVATKNFVHQYEKEQSKQYERIQKLEEEVKHIRTIELRIDRLEKQVNDGKPLPE
jgi:hypothetical protein